MVIWVRLIRSLNPQQEEASLGQVGRAQPPARKACSNMQLPHSVPTELHSRYGYPEGDWLVSFVKWYLTHNHARSKNDTL